MAKTKIHGNRIGDGSIETKHLSKDFKLSEENIAFNLMPHQHTNKDALDIIINSIPQTLKVLDLKDVLYTIMDVSDARDVSKTLRQTLEARASKEEFDNIVAEITDAKKGFQTLSDYFDEFKKDVDGTLATHIGAISHHELDNMYSEIKAARGTYDSISDRLNNSTGGTGTGGSVNVVSLTPWSLDVVLEPGETVIELSNSYVVGNSTLQVFDGPILLQSNVDYKEISPIKIEMKEAFNVPLELRIIGVNSGRLFEWERRVAGNGATARIELADSYRPGARELQVYEDGLLLRENEDYEETSQHVITFKEPIDLGSLVTIYKRRN